MRVLNYLLNANCSDLSHVYYSYFIYLFIYIVILFNVSIIYTSSHDV